MITPPVDNAGHPREPVRGWLRLGRRHRVILLAAVGLLAIGAFLLWGPIGLGNGPLSTAIGVSQGTVDSGPGPVGFLTSGVCGSAWPARSAGRGFVLAGCGGADAGPLIGHAFDGPTPAIFFGFPAAAEAAAPRPGTCWVMTKIVVHYHVGIRHYSASGAYDLAVCSSDGQVNAAMNAADATG